MTALVIASCYDLHADAVVDKLLYQTQCIRVDPDQCTDIFFDSDKEGFYLNGIGINIEDVSGVYCRFPLEMSPCGSPGDPIATYHESENLGALRGIFQVIPAQLWINYPWYENAADGKIRPIQVAKQVGLSVPPFVITNDLAQLDVWRTRHGDDLIIKPITDTAISQQRGKFVEVPDFSAFSAPYTSKFERGAISSLNIDSTPFLIQKRIEKVRERRVVIVDESVYVTETATETTGPLDIRLKKERIEAISYLSDKDRQAVIALKNQLHLRFMTLDFAVDAEGISWLLDVNPSGNWLWQEQQLSLGIPSQITTGLVFPNTHLKRDKAITTC